MSDWRDWWQDRMPEGCDYVSEAFDYAHYVLTEVEPDELDQEDLFILHPDGSREGCPTTHPAWSVWADLQGERYRHSDDGPVVLLDLVSLNARYPGSATDGKEEAKRKRAE